MLSRALTKQIRPFMSQAQAAFSSHQYDVAVLGGGPGGYTAAIRAAQKGLKTVCIENNEHLGGVGCNWGCIPSKSLLEYTKRLRDTQQMCESMGIETGPVTYNFGKMQDAKEQAVRKVTDDVKDTFNKLGIDHLAGFGKFASTHELTVDMLKGGKESVTAKNIIIATGSKANELKNLPFDEQYMCSSDGALEQTKVPKKLMIYGGGIVGIEIGSVYQRLGTEVTVVQRGERLCAFLDPDVCDLYVKTLKEQGIKFMVNTEITVAENMEDKGIFLNMRSMEDKHEFAEHTDLCLISIGRHPNTKNLDALKANLRVDRRGTITTNKTWQVMTENDPRQKAFHPHIYAIGDCAPGTMLVHKAEIEAIAAVDHMTGTGGDVNYDCIPGVIYTSPEVAWVGKSEEELINAGTKYNKGMFDLKHNFRASISHESDGFVKVMTCPETHKFLGIWIIGTNAGEMIAEGVAAYHNGATVHSVAETSHSHPTRSEAFREACMATYDRPVHE